MLGVAMVGVVMLGAAALPSKCAASILGLINGRNFSEFNLIFPTFNYI
jgi:hypothetical protein